MIVALLAIPMVGLLSIKPYKEHPFASKIKLWFDSLEYQTIDYRIKFGRTAKASPSIVLLCIDRASLFLDQIPNEVVEASKPLSQMKANSYPFPREIYAEACDKLFGAGAKVVAFDIMFQKPSDTDAPFRQAIEKYHDRVAIGFWFNDDATSYDIPPASILPSKDVSDECLGYLNYWRDTDDVIRCAQYRNNLEYENHISGAEALPKYYSLAARMVQRAGYEKLVPDDLQARPMRFAGPSRFQTYSFYKLFDPDAWKKDFRNGEFFKDKIVLVGPEGNWFKDVLPTPWGTLAGAEIHLNSMNALIQNEFLHLTPDPVTMVVVLGFSVLAYFLARGIAQIVWRFLVVILILSAYVTAGTLAYDGPGWLFPAVAPISVFCGATGLGFIYDFILNQVEKMQLRATFERYTSPNVAKYLLDHSETYQEMLAGARKPVTVLFSDVRGFTTMTEKADSQELITQLNEYLTRMVSCVFRYDGSLDKFIGDAVMAVWGNTPYNFGPKEDAVRAVRAALDMMKELKELNAKWSKDGRKEWRIGIGLNHGEVIVGDMGSQQRKEFAVIGDPVNLASRLEGQTKEFQVDILMGGSMAELVRDRFHLQTVGLIQVKGKTEPVDTFTVLGEKSEKLPPERQKFLETYEEGVRAFRSREFVKAKELFEQALQARPGNYLAGEYLKDCVEFIQNPPDATWTGVQVMTTK